MGEHECDREHLLEFAKAANLDFACLLRLIRGQTNVGLDLASYIAHKTSTDKKIWMPGGTAADRMMAIRLWRGGRQKGANHAG